MPKISFRKSFPSIQVEVGANLMQALVKSGRPVASSCHGEAVCGKCLVEVVAGQENLSHVEAPEAAVHDRLTISDGFRLSCQSRVLGDIIIDTGYW